MASFLYGNGLKNLLNGSVDWDTDTVKCQLLTSSYTPNKDTHDFRDDLTNEVSGTGYSAGGATVTGKTATYDATGDKVKLDCDDISWPSSTITARYAAFSKSRGGAASADELICLVDFGQDYTSTNGTFLIQINSEGLINITV